MHPYLIEELGRIRRHEIDNEFKRIHLVHQNHGKPASLIRRILKVICGIPASAKKEVKNAHVKVLRCHDQHANPTAEI